MVKIGQLFMCELLLTGWHKSMLGAMVAVPCAKRVPVLLLPCMGIQLLGPIRAVSAPGESFP